MHKPASTFSQASLPAPIQVPAGNKVAWETVGSGDITYECRDKANAPGQTEWVFVGPDAVLKDRIDRKSTRLNSSHSQISYAVFCLKKKKKKTTQTKTNSTCAR